MMQYQAVHDEFPLVLNCFNILSEDKDAATSSTADSLLKNIFSFNFVLGIINNDAEFCLESHISAACAAAGTTISIFYLHLLSTAVPAAAAHLPRAQSEVGAGRGCDQPVRGHTWLPGQCPTGCRLAAL